MKATTGGTIEDDDELLGEEEEVNERLSALPSSLATASEIEEMREEREDDRAQLCALREHAIVLEGVRDFAAADAVWLRALDMDPTDICTLCRYATFLHRRKGELSRAESFYRRSEP